MWGTDKGLAVKVLRGPDFCRTFKGREESPLVLPQPEGIWP